MEFIMLVIIFLLGMFVMQNVSEGKKAIQPELDNLYWIIRNGSPEEIKWAKKHKYKLFRTWN